jgi:hypothetical protein
VPVNRNCPARGVCFKTSVSGHLILFKDRNLSFNLLYLSVAQFFGCAPGYIQKFLVTAKYMAIKFKRTVFARNNYDILIGSRLCLNRAISANHGDRYESDRARECTGHKKLDFHTYSLPVKL